MQKIVYPRKLPSLNRLPSLFLSTLSIFHGIIEYRYIISVICDQMPVSWYEEEFLDYLDFVWWYYEKFINPKEREIYFLEDEEFGVECQR